MHLVLGISDSHNASAALLDSEGNLAALQEERPTRIKNYSGFPKRSIAWLLSQAGIQPEDVDIVALAGFHQPPDRDRKALIAEYRNVDYFPSQIKRILRHTPVFAAKKALRKRERIQRLIRMGFRTAQIRFYEHHQCHAATAYYGWGKYDAPVLVLTCDGAGDGLCATVNVGEDGRLRRLYALDWSHSIAVLYAVVTYMMGMVPLEHEYKIMGMAPYAKRGDAERIAAKLMDLFVWDPNGLPLWKRKPGVPHTYYIKPLLRKIFFEERFDAIMAGVQLFTEKMACEFVRRAIKVTGIRRVALSGGLFMNVKANKAIMELSEVEDLFVFPSCGDETNAIGGCYLAQVEHGNTPPPLGPYYLGPAWGDREIAEAIERAKEKMEIEVLQPQDINQAVAELLAQGEVVARFAGREEFGARSLGNRAILADPRDREVVKRINEMIKNRDFWMPFAASVLDEYEEKYLVNEKKIPAPYMILSFDTTEEGRRDLAAATHPYDGTCRPQVVTKEHNPEYWDLIKKFSAITGVGGVLNTSLNLHGLPLVHSPDDALFVLEKSGLRYLAIGSFLVRKIHEDH